MINVRSNAAKRRWVIYFGRQMDALSRYAHQRISSIMYNSIISCAGSVEHGSLSEYSHTIPQFNLQLQKELYNLYIRVADIFSKILGQELSNLKAGSPDLEQKSLMDIFWAAIRVWARKQAASRIVNISDTTKKQVAKIISDGIKDGQSNKEIAQQIRESAAGISRMRSDTIVRTETHTAACNATDTMMSTTRLSYVKEWATAGDERVRSGRFNHVHADGERVGKDEKFQNTGQALSYPGDPAGSAGNIVRCRCVELYDTEDVAV